MVNLVLTVAIGLIKADSYLAELKWEDASFDSWALIDDRKE
jgi:hypothetical protein